MHLMGGDGVERAVGADAARLLDIELDAPVRDSLPGNERLDLEIFGREHLEIVERAGHHRADDDRFDIVARKPFELQQLMQPDRILIRGAPGIGRDPPARTDDAVLDEREDKVRIAGIDGEEHLSLSQIRKTSPA